MPIMLGSPIEVPGQGTADRLQVEYQQYKLDSATGKQSAQLRFALASATQTFWGPGTLTQVVQVPDLEAFLGANPSLYADFVASAGATLTMGGGIAKVKGLKLADGTEVLLA